MIIYMGLPKLLYPYIHNIIYHPKVCDTMFPQQHVIHELAINNCFLTITEGTKLTYMQTNLLQLWLSNPVSNKHPVYQTADRLQSLNDGEIDFYRKWVDDKMGNSRYVTSTGFHSLADQKKTRKEKKNQRSSKTNCAHPLPSHLRKNKSLGTLVEGSFDDGLEMNQYSIPRDLSSIEKTSILDHYSEREHNWK